MTNTLKHEDIFVGMEFKNIDTDIFYKITSISSFDEQYRYGTSNSSVNPSLCSRLRTINHISLDFINQMEVLKND